MTLQTAVTIFNARVGSDHRREVFYPTVLDGASYQAAKTTSSSQGIHTESLSYRLRIPVDALVQSGRTYVSETVFRSLSDADALQHWTLQAGDCIIPGEYPDAKPMTLRELSEFAKLAGADLIHVKEYADNTLRGSDAVKHWRIGGA